MLLAELHECGFYAYGKWLSRVTFEPKMLDLGATRVSKEAIHSNTRLEREVRNVYRQHMLVSQIPYYKNFCG